MIEEERLRFQRAYHCCRVTLGIRLAYLKIWKVGDNSPIPSFVTAAVGEHSSCIDLCYCCDLLLLHWDYGSAAVAADDAAVADDC